MPDDYLPKHRHFRLALEKQTLISAAPFPALELQGKGILNVRCVHR